MADRTSAAVFGMVFEELAKAIDGEFDPKKLAKKLMKESQGFDFNSCQMGCDKALLKLGVAKMGIDKDYPEDGKRVLYLGEDYK